MVNVWPGGMIRRAFNLICYIENVLDSKLNLMIILGIETSCDETAVSVVKAEGDLDSLSFNLLGSAIHSQIETHREFGGVVPMLAKREHLKNLPIVLEKALEEATSLELGAKSIDLIAVTVGPGLEPALWTGIKFAENLGKSWGKPVIPTNHMMGHVASVLFSPISKLQALNFPVLALLISGGHTEFIMMKNWAEKEKVGETQDDAVGEAYDKVARMLGLPYPGGPEISKLAEEARVKNIKSEFKLPRPMIHSKNLDFSFSGLKTSVLYLLRDLGTIDDTQKMMIAREFEDAVKETIITKTKLAIDKYLPKTLIVGGGVIANKYLRENLLNLKVDYPGLNILIPEKSLTTDNATMIAIAGYIKYLTSGENTENLKADGNLEI